MRTPTIIAFLFIASASFGQNSLDKIVSTEVCTCIRESQKLTESDFLKCFEMAIQKNSDLITKQYMALSTDTSEEAGYKFGLELYGRISVSMIYTCIPYYKFIDSLRNSTLQGLNKDSIGSVIAQMNRSDLKARNKDFFSDRGTLYFQISNLDSAMADFNEAIRLDQFSIQSIYFKAWTLELKRDFDQAFLLYTNLALLTKKNDFNIFAAIVKQKKNGL